MILLFIRGYFVFPFFFSLFDIAEDIILLFLFPFDIEQLVSFDLLLLLFAVLQNILFTFLNEYKEEIFLFSFFIILLDEDILFEKLSLL